MSGTLDGVLDLEVLSAVLGDTSFGNVWIARLVLSIMIIVVIWTRFDSKSSLRWDVIASVLAAALLASLTGVGHSQIEGASASVMHMASDMLQAASTRGSAMAGFATRSSFAGHTGRSAKTNHELASTLDHQMGAGQSRSTVRWRRDGLRRSRRCS